MDGHRCIIEPLPLNCIVLKNTAVNDKDATYHQGSLVSDGLSMERVKE